MTNTRPARRGQSLIEFAVVALATYLLLAAIITFGLLFYAAQGSQTTVDLAARELSRTPLPADRVTLAQVLYGDLLELNADDQEAVRAARRRVYDERYLVLFESDVLDPAGGYNQDLINRLPVVNQQLLPLMIFDEVEGNRVFRYPGAVYRTSTEDEADDGIPLTGYRVAIPLVAARDADGVETLSWVRVLEPIVDEAVTGEPDSFKISSQQGGIVGLRMNYPVQSSAMSSFRPNPAGPFEPTIGSPNIADDSAVNPGAPLGDLVASDRPYGPYAGLYGLGQQAAFATPVRPFRRVVSAQAVYRREIFD